MTWTISASALEQGVVDARARLARDAVWRTMEFLGRALRWVDELQESREWFRSAALYLLRHVEDRGLDRMGPRPEIVGYYVLAGEPAAARDWCEPTVERLLARGGPRDQEQAVATRYLCGDPDGAEALAREFRVHHICLDLLGAERDGDVGHCDAASARLVKSRVANRTAPGMSSGIYPIDGWDWLELSFQTRSLITGESVPSHAEILQRTGLLGPGPSTRRRQPAPGGVDRVTVTAADGSVIQATIDRSEPGHAFIVLDPREDSSYDRYLAIGLFMEGDSYTTLLYTEPESSPQDHLPHAGPDICEAIDAAADYLDGKDFFGRDGTWAARTLRQITSDLPTADG